MEPDKIMYSSAILQWFLENSVGQSVTVTTQDRRSFEFLIGKTGYRSLSQILKNSGELSRLDEKLSNEGLSPKEKAIYNELKEQYEVKKIVMSASEVEENANYVKSLALGPLSGLYDMDIKDIRIRGSDAELITPSNVKVTVKTSKLAEDIKKAAVLFLEQEVHKSNRDMVELAAIQRYPLTKVMGIFKYDFSRSPLSLVSPVEPVRLEEVMSEVYPLLDLENRLLK